MDTGNFVAVICFLLLSCDGFLLSSPARGFCPESCDCQHAQHLLCTNRGLRAVPKVASRVPEDVLVFGLGGNFIGNISAFDFTRYSNLIRLNLQYNQIHTVHPKAFEKLSKLEELYLGHNLLSTIPPGTLQSLKKLTILYSNNNGIKKITPELFGNLESLVKLRLDGNAIAMLQDSVFKSLTNLHYLHLESNQLHHIHRNAFSKLTKLRFLNLSHNKQSAVRNVLTFSQLRALTTLILSENDIQHVANHVFQNLKRLSKLSLSNNRISRLESEALKGLSSVREFLIDGNELEQIPAGILDSLERIEELDFSRNHISTVDSSAFTRLKHLRVLKLKDNRLTSISGNVFALNSVLYDLDLHGNNWTCDCRLGKLKQWMTSAHSQGKLLTGFVQCHHPATLRGKYLDYVNSSQLQAPGNWTHLCESQAGPEESRGGAVVEKEAEDGGRRRDGGPEAKEERGRGGGGEGERNVGRRGTEGEERDAVEEERTEGDGTMGTEGGEERGRDGAAEEEEEEEEEAGIQGDQRRPVAMPPSSERKKRRKTSASPGSRPAAAAAEGIRKRGKGRRGFTPATELPPRSTAPPPTAVGSHDDRPRGPAPPPTAGVQREERFDLFRAGQDEGSPVVTDPCAFNRHFIANVTVDQVTSSTVTVHWTARDHRRYTPGGGPGPGPGPTEVHYRVLFDRFGTADRFPRYVYAGGAARSVTLRELGPDVTYMVCVEGVVGGAVCQVAPRDHCAGLVTLPEGRGGGGGSGSGGGLTSDLQLVTVATLAGNGVLLLVIGGAWLGRSLRRRLRRRKSAVHVRHMYSTRRPFRAAMATTAAVSTDFTSFQSSRPPRLGPLEEGDLIEFPCDRFLDNSTARRDGMQRFSD